MSTIQILLITGISVIGVFSYLKISKSKVQDIAILLFISCGSFAVIFPELTNIIAKKIGIHRGADMLLYFAILFFLFISLKLYGIVRKIKQDQTKIVRSIAIENYEYLKNE